jgi:hypothetical protein
MAMRGKTLIEKAKKTAAVLLLAASLLPFAQCSSKEPMHSTIVEAKVIAQPQGLSEHPPVGRPIYVWRDFKPLEGQSLVFALAFVWPIPVLFARRRVEYKFVKSALLLFELPLCGFTAYLLYCFIRDPFWRLLSGGYIAAVGTVIYILAILADVLNWRRKWITN